MNPPDISGVTNTAMDIAVKSGNDEIVFYVALACMVISIVWLVWAKLAKQ